MRRCCKHISCLFFLLASFMMQGQGLPSLGVAKEISKGKLPNGIEYFLVTNPSDKGFADYALVKRAGLDRQKSRQALCDLEHFEGRTVQSFLGDNGIAYSDNGLIRYTEGASIYSFADVPVHNQSVADSTLLLVMDIAAKSQVPQAIVISGDINSSKIKERMELLSMTVARLNAEAEETGYEWNPGESVIVKQSCNLSSDIAMVRAIFSTERIPRENLSTAQPLLTRSYAQILFDIFSSRIKDAFREASLPLAHLETRYDDSVSGPDDERFYFSVYTGVEHMEEAAGLLASVLSSLDTYGAYETEFSKAKAKVSKSASRRARARYLSNSQYVEKCISAYLYGGNLAGPAVTEGFIASNNLPVSQELPIFNSFVSALLDCGSDLVLRFDAPVLHDQDRLLVAFEDAWSHTAAMKVADPPAELIFSPSPVVAPRLRIRKESNDPISGGKMLTFSNGVRVIYRILPTEGEFCYSLMLRDGAASVPELGEGEAAFVSDMLDLYRVAGMGGREFREALALKGVSMQSDVRVADMRISGTAPVDELSLVIAALNELGSGREEDMEAFDRYREEEALRIDMKHLQPKDVNPVMDSLLRPAYHFSDPKDISNLGEDLPQRAAEIFDRAFSRVNDGLLVLVGDFEEEQLKKDLCRLLGNARVHNRLAQRPTIPARMAYGSVIHKELSRSGLVGAQEISVNVGLSAPAPFSIRNYMSFKMAAEGIRLALIKELSGLGVSVELLCRNEMFPIERVSLFVNCRPCMEDGLPAGMKPASVDEVLEAVRKVFSSLEEISLSDRDLKAYKTRLIADYESSLANPEGVIDAVMVRYSEGRDVVSGYKDAINSLNKDSIKNALQLMTSGAEVEYIIY